MPADITALIDRYGADRSRLLDMLWAIQDAEGHIPKPAIDRLAAGLSISAADIEETVSFYHFFSMQPAGRHRIYLNNDVSAQLSGRYEAVRTAFEAACGAAFGSVSSDGRFGLFETACIGMCDREPAALVDFVPFTDLTPERVAKIVEGLGDGIPVKKLAASLDSGSDIVATNWRRTGPVFDPKSATGPTLDALFSFAPGDILETIAASGLRGRGGAGFSTGLKWRLCREAMAATRYVVCNADEGEPGTFKDRTLLTDLPHLLIEGMVAAAHAVGAGAGIIYLRAEYRYLQDRLEALIADYRKAGWLGENIAGSGLDFDIRIQLGAGAYVCGEESALIESMEGKR
ncbi:MAG: NAD(P)H-dependent oxidoreductase subunit E, partial [Hyphomicrobiales bacterium]|nr:NAD(P)H-dependent oxidoreductase subunit E [Hyphomicrobiales bacterium]